MSNSGLFTTPGFIVSLVGIKKKRTEEIKRKERKKGRMNNKRKKERNEIGVKRKKIVKKKCLLLALNWPSHFCWFSWL